MNRVTHTITLDLLKGGSQASVKMKQAETGARRLAIRLVLGGVPYFPDESTSVQFRAIKPDETELYNAATFDGSCVYVAITTQTVAAPGAVRCELSFTDADGNLMYSPQFEIFVEENLYPDEGIESTDEYTALAEALAAIQALVAKWSTATAEAETGSTAVVDVEVGASGVSFSFTLPRGDRGYNVASVYKKSGTGMSGSTDVYGMKINDADESEIGTFNVYNGVDGQGSGDMLRGVYDQNEDGIVDDAEKLGGELPSHYENVQADWNEADNTDSAYIKNKPSIPSTPADIGAWPENAVHASRHAAGGADAITPASIGAWPENAAHASRHASSGADAVTPASIGAEKQRLQFTDTVVPITAFTLEDTPTYEDFPYRAAVALTGVLADMTPEVVFGVPEAMSGVYAPVSACYAGGVYIYASEVPEAAVAIPTIICWKGVA